jgi:hypothetical protein
LGEGQAQRLGIEGQMTAQVLLGSRAAIRKFRGACKWGWSEPWRKREFAAADFSIGPLAEFFQPTESRSQRQFPEK